MSNPSSNIPGTATGTVSNPPGPDFKPLPSTAIVLSGGGAKGDFEVGALRCLYNRGIRPKILTGTSVGSVNALKLAEGEDTPVKGSVPAGHVRGLAGLEKIWLALENDQNMWAPEAGAAAVFNALPHLEKEFTAIEAELPGVSSATIGGAFLSVIGIPGFAAFAPQMSDLSNISDAVKQLLADAVTTLDNAGNVTGLVNYDPLEARMREPANFFAPFQAESGILLRLAMVALEDGALRYVSEHNQMIERDGKITPVKPPATAADRTKIEVTIGSTQKQIAELFAQIAANASDPKKLASLRGQLVAAMRKLPQLIFQLGFDDIKFDLIRAAIASSSLPVICRPTMMQDGRTYVDGGIRTLAPIQAAIDVGATEVYAIVASSQKFDASTFEEIVGGTPLPLLGIALRVGEGILPDEVARRDLTPDNGWPIPVLIIQPSANVDDIHDGLTIEPGLIRIRMAYGFMRAYDTLKASENFVPSFVAAATEQNSIKGKTLEIVAIRKRIWNLEYPANGKKITFPTSGLPPAPYKIEPISEPEPAALASVRELKLQLRTLLEQRIAYYTDKAADLNGVDSLPADWASWPVEWEKHSWTPIVKL